MGEEKPVRVGIDRSVHLFGGETARKIAIFSKSKRRGIIGEKNGRHEEESTEKCDSFVLIRSRKEKKLRKKLGDS